MPLLLAVDLGLRTRLAAYGADGRLRWYRSQHFANRASLRRGVAGLLDAEPAVTHLVLEGGGPLAIIWAREADRRRIPARQVAAETWRARLLGDPQRLDRDRAKLAADLLARRVIARSAAPRPTSLRHDAAEAILVGLWAVVELGWLPPAEIPGP